MTEARAGMVASKKPERVERLARPSTLFAAARRAFAAMLRQFAAEGGGRVLLPAYVGWSSKEGSGVWDPVAHSGLSWSFYRLNRRLEIDLEHVEQLLERHGRCLLLVIHYFGRAADGYDPTLRLARAHGAVVVEDEAHAMLTDLVGGRSGRAGDAALFSLHKLLPRPDGGVLVVNRPGAWRGALAEGKAEHGDSPWNYDLLAIAHRRRRNAQLLTAALAPLAEELEPLWPEWHPDDVPQTLPYLVRRVSRDKLYEAANVAGIGVVSLYHTLVGAISPQEHPDSHWLSRRIVNLPIHQDVTEDRIPMIAEGLAEVLRGLPTAE